MTDNPRMSTASAERDDGGNGQDMVLGNSQAGEKTGVRHIEKFPIRLNLHRGESVAVVPELFERKTTALYRKQTVNLKKSTIGEGVIA
jgi:hypothetical protein